MNNTFIMSSGGLPEGSYSAVFEGLEPFDGQEEYGPAVQLRFRVVGGPHDGEIESRICSKKMSPKSTLAKFAVALKGANIQSGETVNIDDFVGILGMIIVERKENGGTKISTFLRQQENLSATVQ